MNYADMIFAVVDREKYKLIENQIAEIRRMARQKVNTDKKTWEQWLHRDMMTLYKIDSDVDDEAKNMEDRRDTKEDFQQVVCKFLMMDNWMYFRSLARAFMPKKYMKIRRLDENSKNFDADCQDYIRHIVDASEIRFKKIREYNELIKEYCGCMFEIGEASRYRSKKGFDVDCIYAISLKWESASIADVFFCTNKVIISHWCDKSNEPKIIKLKDSDSDFKEKFKDEIIKAQEWYKLQRKVEGSVENLADRIVKTLEVKIIKTRNKRFVVSQPTVIAAIRTIALLGDYDAIKHKGNKLADDLGASEAMISGVLKTDPILKAWKNSKIKKINVRKAVDGQKEWLHCHGIDYTVCTDSIIQKNLEDCYEHIENNIKSIIANTQSDTIKSINGLEIKSFNGLRLRMNTYIIQQIIRYRKNWKEKIIEQSKELIQIMVEGIGDKSTRDHIDEWLEQAETIEKKRGDIKPDEEYEYRDEDFSTSLYCCHYCNMKLNEDDKQCPRCGTTFSTPKKKHRKLCLEEEKLKAEEKIEQEMNDIEYGYNQLDDE